MNSSNYNVSATSPPPASPPSSSTTHAISSLYHHRPITITVNTVEYNPNYPSKLYVITLPGLLYLCEYVCMYVYMHALITCV